jgi:hypothetical protein
MNDLAECSKIPDWTRLQVFEQMPADGKAWSEWLWRHGLRGAHVALPGWIACDDNTYRIYVDTYVWAPEEKSIVWLTDANHPAREVRTIQLEGKAMPFPETRR